MRLFGFVGVYGTWVQDTAGPCMDGGTAFSTHIHSDGGWNYSSLFFFLYFSSSHVKTDE